MVKEQTKNFRGIHHFVSSNKNRHHGETTNKDKDVVMLMKSSGKPIDETHRDGLWGGGWGWEI